MSHGDAIVDGDGVELLGHSPGSGDLAGHQLSQVLQVHMARHELGERVGDGDDRLVEVVVGHAGGPPERSGAGHVAAVGGRTGAIRGHDGTLPPADTMLVGHALRLPMSGVDVPGRSRPDLPNSWVS